MVLGVVLGSKRVGILCFRLACSSYGREGSGWSAIAHILTLMNSTQMALTQCRLTPFQKQEMCTASPPQVYLETWN